MVTCKLDVDGVPALVRGIVRDTQPAKPESERLDFIVGLEFVDIQEETRALIADYLRRKS
jgi:hypothetical protein